MVNFTLCLFHHNLILKLHILNMYSLLLQLNKVVLKFFNYSLKTKKFPDSSVGKESACNAGDPGSIPGARRSTGERKGYPLQCSGLENFKNYTDHGVTKSQTQLSNLHFHIQVESYPSSATYIGSMGFPSFSEKKPKFLEWPMRPYMVWFWNQHALLAISLPLTPLQPHWPLRCFSNTSDGLWGHLHILSALPRKLFPQVILWLTSLPLPNLYTNVTLSKGPFLMWDLKPKCFPTSWVPPSPAFLPTYHLSWSKLLNWGVGEDSWESLGLQGDTTSPS